MSDHVAYEKVENIIDSATKLIRSYELVISKIKVIIEELNELENDVRISKVTGGVAGTVGSAMAIAGVIAAPFTFGASIALMGVGAGVGIAGGVTGVGATIAHSVVTKKKLKEIKYLMEEDKAAFDKISKQVEGLAALARQGPVIAFKLFDALSDVGSGTLRAASSATRAFMAVSGVLAAITLPFDVYTIVSNSVNIHKGQEHKAVKQLKGVITQLEMSIQKLESLISASKNILSY